MNTEKVTIRAKSDPSVEVSGISEEGGEYFFYLILAPSTPPIAFEKNYWELVITLPTDAQVNTAMDAARTHYLNAGADLAETDALDFEAMRAALKAAFKAAFKEGIMK